MKCKFGEIATGFDYGMNAAAKPYDGQNKYIRITDIDEASSTYNNSSIVSPDGILSENYVVNEGDILLARTGASTGKSYLYRKSDGKLYYAGFLIRANVAEHNPYFVFSQLHTHRYWRWVSIMSARSGQPGINSLEYASFPIFTTTLKEENKISSLLSLIDERITTQNKIIEDLKKLKSAIRKRIFTSLKNEHTENYEINQLLAYEQPSAYIVANDEYSADTTLTPVLTANKGFVLGYTDEDFGIYQKGECIIFDDFTMDAKYVSFPFKVKSSAIKILTAKLNVNLRFMFEYLSYLGLKSEEHKRHYISEIASLVIELPSKEKQNRIANLMTSLDNKLALEEKVKAKYEDKKQYLLSQMFI
ncbi:restriction endonuclease subunit S [Phocaeicola vulgatus]|nr:restriction endonuclease subunit S [Phocaeicola vulgatus]MCE8724427.1 restriction endonuclease subunit S [Phocaeicola vulgatus]